LWFKKTKALKISKEFKAGVLVLFSIGIFIWGFNFLKGKNIFNASTVFYVVFDDIQGLITGTPVTINGFNVGKVQGIEFYGDSAKLRVTLFIDDEIALSKNSVAQIFESSLIGGKAVAILPKFDGAPLAQSGDFLKGELKPSFTDVLDNRLSPLQDKIESLVMHTDSVMQSVNKVLDNNTKSSLQNSIARLEKTLISLESISGSVDKVLLKGSDSLVASIHNINRITENFASISDTLQQASLGQTIRELQGTVKQLNGVLDNINEGKGTLGKMANDEALYNNLEKSTKQLELLLQDFRLNPKRYVHFSIFGKKAKPFEVPEENQ